MGGMNLVHSSHLRKYIPMLLEEERAKVISAIGNESPVSIIFDGYSKKGEAEGFIVRYVEDCRVKQKLLALSVLWTRLRFLA